jgi:Uma2 family endonuclease
MTIADQKLPPPPDFEKSLPKGLRMSEEEFIAWYTFEGQAEWVDGEVVIMSPVSLAHEHIQWWVKNLLKFYCDDKRLGMVMGPQFVMRLKFSAQRKKVSRREPDILFVAEARKDLVKPNHLDGPPDLAVEIISPESQNRDRRQKYLEYESAGVAEYWIIDPLSETVDAFAREGESFVEIPERQEKITSRVVPGWYLRPAWLWQQPRLDVRVALAELGIK